VKVELLQSLLVYIMHICVSYVGVFDVLLMKRCGQIVSLVHSLMLMATFCSLHDQLMQMCADMRWPLTTKR